MKILSLCLSPGLGGLELYALRSASALSRGHRLRFVCRPGTRLAARLREAGIPALYWRAYSHHLPLLGARRLARIIDALEIDLIHMHWGKDLALASLAKRFSRRKPKLVYTRQMMITREKKDFYHRFIYAQVDAVLTITQQLEQLCKRFLPGDHIRIQTLYYGVNAPEKFLDESEKAELRRQYGFTDDAFVTGLFGRLEHGKGQHLLIEALAQANSQGRRLHALIVGHEMTAGYREQLRQQAQVAGVAEQIVFSDFVEQPQQLMQICNVVCLTSFEETFGLVLPEAMRAGVAVIGSDKGGVPEIIEHEKTGLLFASGDAEDLCRQLCHLYDAPEWLNELAARSKARADALFNHDQHFASLENLFDDVCAN